MEHAKRPAEAVTITRATWGVTVSSPWWLPALVVGAILYGSLLPFHLEEFSLPGSLLAGLGRIGFHSSPGADLLINIAVYFPLGFAAVLAGKSKRWPIARVPVVMGLAILLSGTVELIQSAMPARVASWVDVRSNALGATLGAMAACLALRAWPRVAPPLAAHWRRSPLHTASAALAVGLLLYAVAPFDFIANAEQLRASFLRAHWDFTRIRPSAPGAPPLRALVTQALGMAWFALLAYLWALGARQRGRDRFAAAASTLKNAAILVVLCELMQLFTRSRVFDTASILLRLLGVAGGTWLALGLVDRWPRMSRSDPGWWAFPRPLVGVILVFHLLLMGAGQISPPPLGTWPGNTPSVSWMPFESLWRLPWSAAIERGLSIGITFASLTVAMLLWQRRCSAGSWLAAVAASVGVAALGESMASFGGRRPWDVTQPVAAMLVAAATCWGAALLARAHAAVAMIPLPAHRNPAPYPFTVFPG